MAVLFGKVRPDFYRHHKTRLLSHAARGVWLCGLAYCRDNNTDGFIPVEDLEMLSLGVASSDIDGFIDELVAAEYWSRVTFCDANVTERDSVTVGFHMIDYEDHQLSTGAVENRKERARERKARQRQREKAQKQADPVTRHANVTRDQNVTVTRSQNVTPLEVEVEVEVENPLPKQASARADIFAALAEIDNADPDGMTQTQGSKFGKLTSEIMAAGCDDPSEVARRAAAYRCLHPDWSLTAAAVVKHWASLDTPVTVTPSRSLVYDEAAAQAAFDRNTA